jgi:hypothetical protein
MGPTSLRAIYAHSAVYVDRVLKGANRADLPVEQAAKLELVINLKTAKAIGLSIPQPLLLRADRLIERRMRRSEKRQMPLVCAAVPDLAQASVSLIRRASAPSNLDGRFANKRGTGLGP